MRKIVFAALCAFAAVAVSCKNDRESDVNPGDSDIDGLYINEVYSCNPDWVELYNAGNKELHIGGFILQDDKGAEEEYVIPEGTTIGAGEFLVLEEFSFGISSSKGDRVTLLDASRNVVDDVMLPVMEDGSSYGRRSDGGSEFAAFTAPTKGRSNTGGGDPLPEPEPSDAKVYINEVLSAPAGDDMDFIELYNGGEADADIGGFVLQDDKGAAEEFVIPAGTVIPAGGFLTYDVCKKNAEGPSFGLGKSGDWVFVYDPAGVLVAELEIPAFADDEVMSYGRMPDGGDVLRKMEPTKNSSNGGEVHPEVAVVINEILTNGSQDEDWVEFYNGGSADADLEGYVLYDDGGVEKAFTFPAGTTVPAGGYLVMVAKEEGSFDFGLGKKGDALTLLDASGAVTDEVEIPALDDDETYGRRTDGAAEWTVFGTSTRGASNAGGTVRE